MSLAARALSVWTTKRTELSVQFAFHGGRLVLSLILVLGMFSGDFGRFGWWSVVVFAAVVASVALACIHFASSQSWLKPIAVGDAVFVLIDAVLALGVMTMTSDDAASLAWVALIIPVAEAALVFGLATAFAVWVALGMCHLTYAIATANASTGSFTFAIQQLLAVLLVAVPASLVSNAARSRLEALTEDRLRADQYASQLQAVGNSVARMSAIEDSSAVLTETVAGVISMGFDAADIVSRQDDGQWVLVSRMQESNWVPAPPQLLAPEASATITAVALRPDTPAARQVLHEIDATCGYAARLDTIGFQQAPILRAWSRSSEPDTDRRLGAFALLANQAAKIHANAVSSENAERRASQLAFEAAHDPLTGLANHSHILDRLDDLLDRNVPTSVFFIDLDGFKPINDRLGHKAGDTALIVVARRLNEVVGNLGVVGRMGGDEFVIVGSAIDLAVDNEAFGLAAACHRTICEPMIIDGAHVSLGASVGSAMTRDQPINADELLTQADKAMYAVKEVGGGTAWWDGALGPVVNDVESAGALAEHRP